MKTIEIEVALMKALDIRTNIIVPNMSYGITGSFQGKPKSLHECDLLVLSKSNYATEIEIKISKYDIQNEAKKAHGHNNDYINKLFFAVPEELEELALELIPDKAGLFVISQVYNPKTYSTDLEVSTSRKAERNESSVKWTDKDRHQLTRLGTMRIYKLKEKLSKYVSV